MSYISIVEKLNNKLSDLAMFITDEIDNYNKNVGEYPTMEMLAYEQIKNKKQKILEKMGKITLRKVGEVYDSCGYFIDEEYEIEILGKKHKYVFGNDTRLPNGEVIGWETVPVDF